MSQITLSESLKAGRLQDFIAQEEARGVAPVDPEAFDAAIRKAVKPPQSEDRTSRSTSAGYPTGK